VARQLKFRGLLPLAAIVVSGLVSGCGSSARRTPGAGAPPPDLAIYESGAIQFPGATWVAVEHPSEWGWSEEQLSEAWAYVEEELESASVMVVHRGVLIDSWGDIGTRYNGQSIRKSLLGALLGQEVAAGRLDPDSTLAELGIDDSSQPLTSSERGARVVDLLQSRSGIYLSALYEAGGWKRRKPARGAHPPGTTWYYNNWGFNALGTVFESVSGSTIDQAFQQRVAQRIEMEDYRPRDVHYVRRGDLTERLMGNDSEHAAYVFMISARDLARFGLLYLAGGRWRDDQVVPAQWVERSTGDSVETLDFLGGDRYGYLWWVSPAESELGRAISHASYKATGGRGHRVVVIPELQLVVVHRLATGGVGLLSQLHRRFSSPPSVDDLQFQGLMERIVAAHPSRQVERRGSEAS